MTYFIHSASWDVHLRQLRAVLGELRRAANPAKCRLGLEETSYLGYQVGWGNVRPQESKVSAISDWPRPTSKKQVKSFLGRPGESSVTSDEPSARSPVLITPDLTLYP